MRPSWRCLSQARLRSTPGRAEVVEHHAPVSPSGASRSARLAPRKPAPPVTSTGRRDELGRPRSCHQPPCFELRRASSTRSLGALPRHPSASSREPSSKSSAGSKPSSSRGQLMSAKQWRMSPARALPVISGVRLGRPIAAASMLGDIADRVRPAPLPTLKAWPAAWRLLQRQAKARATSSTCTKSRRCCAVLEDQRRSAVEQPRGEDREHAGIGVGKRLAGAVDIEQPQRHRFDAIGRAEEQHRAFLREFGERVDGREVDRLLLGGGRRLRRAPSLRPAPTGRPRWPRAGGVCRHAAGRRRPIQALAIDAHRRGHDQAADRLSISASSSTAVPRSLPPT